MYSKYDDPNYVPAPGERERDRLKQLKYELRQHQKEASRLCFEIKRLESLPNVLDIPLPFD